MNKMNEKQKRWLVVTLWTFSIYSTLYVVRFICDYLIKNTPFNLIVNSFVSLSLIIVLFICFLRIRVKRISTYFLVLLTASFYAFGLYYLKIPAEKIHFLEYGLLAYFVFHALILDCRPIYAYFFALLITSIIGLGDEGIQYFLPNRYFEWRDCLLNAVSAGLGLLLVYTMNCECKSGTNIKKT